MRLFVFGGLILTASVAYAAEPTKPDPALCRTVTAYTPSADVGYKSGVDAHGHYVAPADVNSEASPQLPSKIEIPLTVSLAKALNFDTTQYPYNQLGAGTEAQLGIISVEGNQVTFNGKPLSAEEQSNLAVACRKESITPEPYHPNKSLTRALS